MLFRLIFALLPFLLFTTVGENADGDDGTTDDAGDDRDDNATDTLGDAGKAALKAEREARKAAEKARADAEKRLSDLEAKARKQAEDEAAEQGRWKELAERREADLTEATTTRDTLQQQLDTALKVVSDTLAATWDTVPEEVRDLYDGADDDPLAKQAFLAKPATKKLIERLTEKAHTPGNGPNPKPSDGDTKTNIREALKAIRYT